MIFKSILVGLSYLDNSTGEDAESHHVLYFNEPADDDQKAIVDKILSDNTVTFPIKHWETFEDEEAWIKDEDTIKFSKYLERLKK